MANIFQYGVKAANTLATATRAGLLSAAHFTQLTNAAVWSTRFRAGSAGHTGNVMVDAVAPDGNLVLNGQVSSSLASNLRLRDDDSAWDHNNAAQPGQAFILRSTGGNNTVEFYNAPAGGPPAALANLWALSDVQFGNDFKPPVLHGYHNANQAIPTALATPLAFNSLYTNNAGATGAAPATATSPLTITIPVSGWWLFNASVYFAASAAGTARQIFWRINGANDFGHVSMLPPGAVQQLNSTLLTYCTATNTVQLMFYQDSGGALNVLNYAGSLPWVSAQLIKAL